jgi:hypothetical protein
MSVYVVTWDLNRAKPNYSEARTAFISHLQNYQHIKDGGLDSVWFISTQQSANQIDSYLRQRLDDNDRLFVSLLRLGEHQGWLEQAVWDWINARV